MTPLSQKPQLAARKKAGVALADGSQEGDLARPEHSVKAKIQLLRTSQAAATPRLGINVNRGSP